MWLQVLGEFIGTLILVLLGDGVVAGNVLKQTKEEQTGWLAITIGWGVAVTIGAYCASIFGPAHLNPAVTLGMAVTESLPWHAVLPFIGAQFLGAMIGATLVWLHYGPHWQKTTDKGAILGTFATAPAIRDTKSNVFGEILGTAVLIIGVMAIGQSEVSPGLGPVIVGFIVLGIGLSLGATTGYAINPARDLGPRIMHTILPIANKGGSDWGYAWIPVLGPIVGGTLGALAYQSMINLL